LRRPRHVQFRFLLDDGKGLVVGGVGFPNRAEFVGGNVAFRLRSAMGAKPKSENAGGGAAISLAGFVREARSPPGNSGPGQGDPSEQPGELRQDYELGAAGRVGEARRR